MWHLWSRTTGYFGANESPTEFPGPNFCVAKGGGRHFFLKPPVFVFPGGFYALECEYVQIHGYCWSVGDPLHNNDETHPGWVR